MRRALTVAALALLATVAEARPLPLPYAPGVGAEAAIAAARARALHTDKRLLIDLGANWCLACRRLAGIMQLPSVHAIVARHYEVVAVDVGRLDRNLDIPMRLGFKGRALFLPALIVVDPRARRVVNHGEEMTLTDGRTLTPQAVVSRLTRWAK